MYYLFTYSMSFLHIALPLGVDIGLAGVAAFYLTRLRPPSNDNVISIFGAKPGGQDSDKSGRHVPCIAHRGAGFDAPENTLQAFKYCVERDCRFVEFDVRTSMDGKLVLLHDKGLQRVAESSISDIQGIEWDKIKNIDVGANHPNRSQFKKVHLCLLDDALDYLIEKKVKFIIDVKGDDKRIIEGILKTFVERPILYKFAVVTCFNPFVLYQIRRKDPEIVGALSYRPYCFSAQDYDAENGPTTARFDKNLPLQTLLKFLDFLHSILWRTSAKWCNVSAVLLHKDIVSPQEVSYWRNRGVYCCGWCVNRPLEKLYWRGILKAPYLANTLVGEPSVDTTIRGDSNKDSAEPRSAAALVDKILDNEKIITTGQH